MCKERQKDRQMVGAEFEMPRSIWSLWESLSLGDGIWELSAIRAKEMNGVTQSVYVEEKEAEVRHQGTDRIQNL